MPVGSPTPCSRRCPVPDLRPKGFCVLVARPEVALGDESHRRTGFGWEANRESSGTWTRRSRRKLMPDSTTTGAPIREMSGAPRTVTAIGIWTVGRTGSFESTRRAPSKEPAM